MTDTEAINREVIRRNFEIISAGADNRAAEVVSDDYVNYESGRQPPGCEVPGPAGLAVAIRWLNSVFSDLDFKEELLICEAEQAALHCVMSGRHSGAFNGLPPTGQRVSVRQTHLFRMSGGRIAEHRMVQDDVSLLSQLGAPPIAAHPELDQVAERFTQAVLAGNAAAATGLCAPDVVHEVALTPESRIIAGRDRLHELYQQLFTDQQITSHQLLRAWHGAGFALRDSLFRARVTGSLAGLPGLGREISWRELCLLEFRDRLISRIVLWPDLAAIEKQLSADAYR